MIKKVFLFSFFSFLFLKVFAQGTLYANHGLPDNNTIEIPIGGNTWKSGENKSGGKITSEGITNWKDANEQFSAFVRIANTGTVKLWLHAKMPDGTSRIRITVGKVSKVVDVKGGSFQDHYVGEWKLKDTGYLKVGITGISKTSSSFADIRSFKLAGSAINEQTAFVRNNEGNFFYWGRRGPSVHLSYALPENRKIEWFYNEVKVPKGEDVLGSYFMANGFGEGYFGIQVNSPTERRILFSVWSPFNTDDPKQIPEDQKIQLLKKGAGVYTGEFGNEGSGGQSYLRYNWKADTTYRFLLHGIPDGETHTVYTAYFFAPEKGEWMLIASFRRPKTNTYLKRLHSFLENFSPEQGIKERKVLFLNQWVRDVDGNWLELNKARFTGDNTAVKGYRKDFAGGMQNGVFFLRNCGFFSNYTPLNTWYERPLSGRMPDVDLGKLP
jgi:hypothetical protein